MEPRAMQEQLGQDVAALKARSDDSRESRSYLTLRLDDLAAQMSGPEGLLARLVRLEAQQAEQRRQARRRMAWAVALVPLLTLLIQAGSQLLANLKLW